LRVFTLSLGCAKNSVDSENLLGLLESSGAEIVDEIAWGRSYREAPDVDGLVAINGGNILKEGDFVEVRVTDAAEYDLFAEIARE
jgi:tRNA A37 methylthiotransferase MiaB